MEKIIACCGLNCTACEARIATVTNDNALRQETAEKWQKAYNSPGITAEMINCTGCMEPGVKIGHASECQIRNCAIVKGYKTCSECKELTTCAIISPVHKYAPEALQNLINLRN
jgi:hypothetical protein